MIDQAPAIEKLAVILLDVSGTASATTAKCLSVLGFAAAGPQSASGDKPAAPGGGNEIECCNDSILADLGSAWDRPALFPAQGQRPLASFAAVDAMVSQHYLPKAVAALDAAFGERRQIVIDDRRITLFSGLWDAALKQRGFRPRRFLVLRNPLECIEAMHRENQLGRPRCAQLWLRYTLAALTQRDAWPERIVQVGWLQERKAAAIFDIARSLDLFDPATASHRPAIDAIIDDSFPEPVLPDDVVFQRPLLSQLLKDCYRLCLDWHERSDAARAEAVAELNARFEDWCLLAGALVQLRLPASMPAAPVAAPQPPAPSAPPRQDGKRCVIIHYHLFKNAGTSVDAILRHNFGERWTTQEYDGQTAAAAAASVRALFLERPELIVLSSHTLLLPPPDMPGIDVFPIIFVRHPIDRIKSAYTFERTQQADTEGARLAKQLDFPGYVRARLDAANQRIFRNSQTLRLAMADRTGGGTELERALRASTRLPFVGSVEAFDLSIQRLQQLLAERFPGFQVFQAFANVSRPERRLEARIEEIRAELGDELYERVTAANADDLVLYRTIRRRYRPDEPSAIEQASPPRSEPRRTAAPPSAAGNHALTGT